MFTIKITIFCENIGGYTKNRRCAKRRKHIVSLRDFRVTGVGHDPTTS